MRSNADWKELLINIYTFLSSAKSNQQKETVRSYCTKVLKSESCYRRIQDVWKQLDLEKCLNDGLSPSDGHLKAQLEDAYPSVNTNNTPHGRNLSTSSNSYFDKGEDALFCECVAMFARMGFPLEKADLKSYADAFLHAESLDIGSAGISMDTVERIYKEGRLKAKTNVDPVDPKRAAQADPEILNAQYHQLDAWIKSSVMR
ncbi:hypothetical protein SEMRO_1919_G305460.1 [Seminavis robusta]|uniref:Uncharacterized protein n=1 Tax=Seminavis robusta TaxID=568900 RepID=A0A9N8ETH8_9STRA|nr:hypothetical protein SEMRO_1919_G305460.1 [Seminavis robusta]|eukprot:Sro1919_g305460.1 n/a (202) ;mRNA; f:8760-9365